MADVVNGTVVDVVEDDDDFGTAKGVDVGGLRMTRRAVATQAPPDKWGVRSVTGTAPVLRPVSKSTAPTMLTHLMPEPPTDIYSRPAKWGWRGWVNDAFRRRLLPGPAEVEFRSRIEAIMARFAGPPQIVMVANPKGGAGKTTTSLMLGNVFGLYRGGGVVVTDCSDAKGTLAIRAAVAGGEDQPSVWDVLERANPLLSTDVDRKALEDYLRIMPGTFVSVLAADTVPGQTRILDAEDCATLVEVLRRHMVGPLIMDTGNVDRSESFLWLAHHATQLVLPLLPERDQAHAAVSMLEDLRKRGEREARLAAGAIAIIPDKPVSKATRTDVEEVLRQAGVQQILRVPFCPMLAAGERIVYPNLPESTTRPWVRATATVAEAIAVNTGRE